MCPPAGAKQRIKFFEVNPKIFLEKFFNPPDLLSEIFTVQFFSTCFAASPLSLHYFPYLDILFLLCYNS
jgi:hypothetical protein